MNFRQFSLPAIGLATLCALQLLCLARAPAVHAPAVISVALKPGQSISLGRAELAAPQAAPSHLALRRDAAGHWWLRNASAGKQVLLQRDGADHRMGASALRAGQWFRIGAAKFDVSASSERSVAFKSDGAHWTFDGATLRRGGSAQPSCPGTGLGARVLALWNRAMPDALTAPRPLTFGGNLRCGNRIGIPYLAGASAVITRTPGGLALSNAAGSEATAPVLLSSSGGSSELALREERLDGVTALTAGRTRMAVNFADGQLHLRPLRNTGLYTEPRATLPDGVEWQWKQRSAWHVPLAAPWLTILVLCALLAWSALRWPLARNACLRLRGAAIGTALLAVAGVGAMLSLRAGSGMGVGWSILLGWAALWSGLLAPGRTTLATSAGLLLLAAGTLMQLEMGLGAMESSMLRHFQKTSALMAIGLGAFTHLRLRLQGHALEWRQARLEWTLAGVAGVALLALLVQVVFGDETGVFDLQPVEFAKLALTALTAHCIAIGLGWHRAMPQQVAAPVRWARMAGPVLLFAALLGVALVQVDDFSPLILLLVWSMAMALAWSIAARRPAVVVGLATVVCLAIASIAWMRLAGASDATQWAFYADRFAVWLDPARHPHTGQQLLLAARAIADGAWWGADNWLGIGALGEAAGTALQIPAVQDDFAPAFFINRHGLLGALALWGLQAAFLAGLLHTAAGAFYAAERARDFRLAWLWRFRCFVLCGGAAFVLGHLLLSWGTNLAIFPIMGQPMSFLSAGGSHLLFFICPLLAFDAVSAQSLEESQSCRSMSNTKSWAR